MPRAEPVDLAVTANPDPTRYACPCGWQIARTAATRAGAARAVERARRHHVALAHPDGDPAEPPDDVATSEPRAATRPVEGGPSPYRVPMRDYLLVLLLIVILAALMYAMYLVAVDPHRIGL